MISGTPRPGNGMPMLLVQKIREPQRAGRRNWLGRLAARKVAQRAVALDSINILRLSAAGRTRDRGRLPAHGHDRLSGVLAINARLSCSTPRKRRKFVWSGGFALTGSDQASGRKQDRCRACGQAAAAVRGGALARAREASRGQGRRSALSLPARRLRSRVAGSMYRARARACLPVRAAHCAA